MNDLVRLERPDFPTEVKLENEWIERRDKILVKAKDIQEVETQDQYEDAEVALSRITKISNDAEKKRKEFSKPFSDFAKQIKAMSDDARSLLESEKQRIKDAMKQYIIKKEEEAQKKLEEEAKAATSESPFAQHIQPPAETPSAPVGGSMSSARKVWQFEIVDESQIPREYLMVDQVKIRKYIQNNKGMSDIPGIKVFEDTRVQSR